LRRRHLLAAAGLALLPGCATVAAPGGGSNGSGPEDSSKRLRILAGQFPYTDAALKEFRDRNPGLTVAYTDGSVSFEEGSAQTLLRSGRSPDVILVNSGPGRAPPPNPVVGGDARALVRAPRCLRPAPVATRHPAERVQLGRRLAGHAPAMARQLRQALVRRDLQEHRVPSAGVVARGGRGDLEPALPPDGRPAEPVPQRHRAGRADPAVARHSRARAARGERAEGLRHRVGNDRRRSGASEWRRSTVRRTGRCSCA
jgi:hypothetical protein